MGSIIKYNPILIRSNIIKRNYRYSAKKFNQTPRLSVCIFKHPLDISISHLIFVNVCYFIYKMKIILPNTSSYKIIKGIKLFYTKARRSAS